MSANEFIGKPIEELLGSKIKTIDAWVDFSFEAPIPTIHLCKMLLEDGRCFHMEGEHDNAYLPLDVGLMKKENILLGCVDDPVSDRERVEQFYNGNI